MSMNENKYELRRARIGSDPVVYSLFPTRVMCNNFMMYYEKTKNLYFPSNQTLTIAFLRFLILTIFLRTFFVISW